MLTITRDLNVYSSGMPQIISLSQYDSDFQLVFNLYTSEGTLNIPSGTTAQIQGTKRDGNGYSASATITGNTVTVTGHNQMTACAGANIYEISLTNSGKVLNTINFILAVEPAAMDAGTIQNETVLKELQAIIDSAATSTQAAQDAEDAADRAEEAARSLTVDPTLTQSGQPADAKVTGDEINDLKKDLSEIGETVYLNETITEVSNPITSESSATKRTSIYVNLESGHRYKLSFTITATISKSGPMGVYATDTGQSKPDERIWDVSNAVVDTEYVIEYNAERDNNRFIIAIFTFIGDITINATVEEMTAVNDAVEALEIKTDSIDERLTQVESKYNDCLVSIFESFTAIGDSLTCGFVSDGAGHSYSSNTARNKKRNWPTYLALNIGRPMTNLGRGSSTVRDWRYGNTSLDVDITTADIDTQCYLVGLGVNDIRGSLPVGTSADISTDKANNADSFYGNYDFVIRTLIEYKTARISSTKIFVFTIPDTENGEEAYNEAIRYVASLYTDVHVIDLATLYPKAYNNPPLSTVWVGKHSRPIGYAYMAMMIKNAINSYMQDHVSDFAYTPWDTL